MNTADPTPNNTPQPTLPSSSNFDGLLLLADWRRLVPLATALGLLLLFGVTLLAAILIALTRTTPVTVINAGSRRQLDTRAETVAALLTELDIAVGENDRLTPDPETPIESGMIIRLQRPRIVTLNIEDEPRVLQTTQTNPLDILEAAGVQLAADDRILLDGTETDLASLASWPVPVSNIAVLPTVTIEIVDGEQKLVLQTTADSVGDALVEAGIELYLADHITPDLNAPLEDAMQVVIRRSAPVSIVADGAVIAARAEGLTVADALAEAGITLSGLDYTIPAEDAALQPGIFIRVIRVHEELIIEQEILEFETIFQPDPTLELDGRNFVQEGQNGISQRVIRVRLENGAEISRQTEENILLREPVNRVVSYGTNVVLRTIDTPDGPRQYWRRIRVYATSYHPAALGGDDVTAIGAHLEKGIIGAFPGVIAYNTNLYVPGYGLGIMADTGLGLSNTKRWIDLGYSDDDFEIWSQFTDVYLLTPVPSEIQYILPE